VSAAPRESEAGHGALEPVCVVIPSYRDAPHVRNLVTSIGDTVDRELVDVIVCDDASGPAHTAELDDVPGIDVVAGERNRGFAANVNRGLRVADPDRDVVVVNSDVVCLPGWLEWLQRSARSAPDVAVVGGQLLFPDGSIQSAGSVRDRRVRAGIAHRYYRRPESFGPAGVAGPVLAVTGACMYLTRAAISGVGMFDEAFSWIYEDVDWCLRAWQSGFRVMYEPRARVTHLQRDDQTQLKGERIPDSHQLFWERWSAFLDDRQVHQGAALRIVYVVDGRPSSGVLAQVEGLRDRGHEVQLVGLGDVDGLQAADAIKVSTSSATAVAVWTASVVRGRPVALTNGEALDEVARHEFHHLTSVPRVHERLQELDLDSTLLPEGDGVATLAALETVLKRVAAPAVVELTNSLAVAEAERDAYRSAHDEVQMILAQRRSAPRMAASALVRRARSMRSRGRDAGE
jgi:GT2 family glycosyltransferase